MEIWTVFKQNDLVLMTAFLILWVMSLISWGIFIIQLIKFLRLKRVNKRFFQLFWSSDSLSSAVANVEKLNTPLSRITKAVVKACDGYFNKNSKQLQTQVNFDEFVTREIKKEISKEMKPYTKGFTALASIGATAPFVGLFGTVWGIYHALINISMAGQVSIAEVSGPIGEALVATAFGLGVAIPAVLFYNTLVRLNKNLAYQVDDFAYDLRTQIINEEF